VHVSIWLTGSQATAISRIDNLEFLSDTVPKTKTYRQYREERAREAEAKAASGGLLGGVNGDSGASVFDTMKAGHPNGGNETNGSPAVGSARPQSSHSRTHSHPDPIRDIVMSDE
jgi:hypothetical protein